MFVSFVGSASDITDNGDQSPRYTVRFSAVLPGVNADDTQIAHMALDTDEELHLHTYYHVTAAIVFIEVEPETTTVSLYGDIRLVTPTA